MLWCLLAAVRVFLTLWPQSGYIHPDEFFQSVEIAAGDLLHYETFRPWEFNSSFPIRSIVPVYLLCGPPLLLLRMLEAAGYSTMTTYVVLIFPRLCVLLHSFVIDLCVFRTLNALGHDGRTGLLLVSSSYVTLVYFTRTFSNSLEGILFAVLLLETLCRNCSSKNQRLKQNSETSDAGSVFRISTLIVVGLFNRPTFAAFALVPFVYWLFSGGAMSGRTSDVRHVLQRLVGSATVALFVALTFTICDSIYFGYLMPDVAEIAATFQDKGFLNFLVNNLTVPPLNFFQYNIQVGNLAEHGIHARYTHFLANIQILFCMLGIIAVQELVNLIVSVFKRDRRSYNSFSVILMSHFIPLFLLSIFPHQEPRFLIPLLCPLVILSSSRFSGQKFGKCMIILWSVFNLLGCAFFGFCHQGGIIPAISRIHQEFIKDTTVHTGNVVFWETYMPPRHLFLQDPSYREPVYQIYDLAGSSENKLIEVLNFVGNKSERGTVLLIVPGTMVDALDSLQESMHLEIWGKFCPHFSGENLPTMNQMICQTNEDDLSKTVSGCSPFFERIHNLFSLHVFIVNFSV